MDEASTAMDPGFTTENPNDTTYDPLEMCSWKGARVGYLYIMSFICIVGVLLNILNLIVFTRKQLVGSTFSYLAAMAIMDMTSLSLVIPLGPSRCLPAKSATEQYLKNVYEAFIYLPIANMFATTSVWITMAVSVERYIYIARPLLAKKVCKPATARKCALLLFILSVGLNSPYFCFKYINSINQLRRTRFGKSVNFKVYSWCRLLLAKIIPVIFIGTFNGLLVRAVWITSRRRMSFISQHSSQNQELSLSVKITIMLITISAVFLVCHSPEPFGHPGIYTSMFGPDSIHKKSYLLLNLVANLLELTSYATNFFVYCAFNRMFVNVLLGLLGCKTTDRSHNHELQKV